MAKTFLDLEDYGIVGNQETVALIGRDGSVDWLCLPYFDSPSAFGAILDPERGGRFSITPVLKFHSIQRYIENSSVLQTDFTTAAGEGTVTDFMPPMQGGADHRMLLRKVAAVRRDCTFQVTFHPCFDYGRKRAAVRRMNKNVIATEGSVALVVAGGGLIAEDGLAHATISLREGKTCWVVLIWGEAPKIPTPGECERLLKKTLDFWVTWSSAHNRSESVHHELCPDLAVRSGLTLKLLLHAATGGIVAAATTSLPETIGGIRNWDYRFAWIRDASFTAQALFHLGYPSEAAQYRSWARGILTGIDDMTKLQPFYPLHKASEREEGIVEALIGYRGSAPVRVGNLASHQVQLDIYGELVNTVFETGRFGEELEPPVWHMVQRVCDHLCRNWNRKDRGMWEMRSDPRHFVHSKLMCWVALDRAIRMAGDGGLAGDVGAWRLAAEEIRAAILEKGYSKRLNSFVQCFDGEELDATAFLIPVHRFLPPDDPRVQSTIDVVWQRLSAGNGLLYRYTSDDGIAGKEGAFILCSFWLVTALSVCRRTEEAELVFRQMLEHVSPLGLMSEEVDPATGKLIGNLPQALSHVGLINAALHLGIAKGRGFEGPPPQSEAEMD